MNRSNVQMISFITHWGGLCLSRKQYVPYRTVPYHIVQYRNVPYRTVTYHIVQYHTVTWYRRSFDNKPRDCSLKPGQVPILWINSIEFMQWITFIEDTYCYNHPLVLTVHVVLVYNFRYLTSWCTIGSR